MREGWKYIKLGEIIHIKHGYGFKGEYFVEEPNNNFLLTPGNFAIGGGFKSDKMKYYDGPINDEFILSAGDVIVTMTDLSKQADTLGYSAKIPSDPENTYLHNQRLGLVSLKTNDFDLDYIYWLLRTQYYQKYIAGSSSGATVKHTSPKKIYSTKLLVPESKETQRKIARILSAYDDLIENNLKRIKLLEEKAQLTYEEWFVRMKFPGYETTPINKETGLPEGWEKVKLTDHIELLRGIEPGSKNYKDSINDGLIPFIRVGDLSKRSSNIFVSKDIVKNKIAKRTDVLLSLDGSPGLVVYGLEGAYSTGVRKAISKNINIKNSFIFALLSSDKIQGLIRNHATGSTILHAGGSVKYMSFDMPTKNILDNFNDLSEDIFFSVLNLNKQNALLKEARDILLPRLMTGMIDVEKIQLENLQPTTA